MAKIVRQILVLIFLVSFLLQDVISQHTVDFQIPANVCIGEAFQIQNASDPGDATWNFCSPLNGSYVGSPDGNLTPTLAGISLIEYNGLWLGFAVNKSNQLLRMEFISNPGNSGYNTANLGNPGGLINNPEWIHVVESNGKWYGLVTNQGNEIIRLTWTDLLAAPTAQSLNLSSLGVLDAPAQVEIELDGNNYVALVANSGSNRLTLINFGTSLENMPGSGDVIQSPVFTGPVNMYGVTAKKMCEEWFIFTSVTDKMYRVDVGPQLFSPIVLSQVADITDDIPLPIGAYVRLKSVVEGGDLFVYYTSYTTQKLAAFSWRPGAVNAVFKDLTYVAVPGQLYSLEVYQNGNSYGLFVGNFNNGDVYHIANSSACSASQQTSTAFVPNGIYFTAAGTYVVTLSVKFADGIICSDKRQIIVSSLVAPDINFNVVNKCVNHDIIFTSENLSLTIANYAWEFGDGNTSTNQNPVYQYSASGNYTASIDVTANNGCHNYLEKTVSVYNEPLPDFLPPSNSPLCSNQDYLFDNTSTVDPGYPVTWQWIVNGTQQGNNEDFTFAFPQTTSQNIRLIASIPGCESFKDRVINSLVEGPVTNFSFSGQCEDENVSFTNSSSGTIHSYSWDFGDGQNSTDTNPTHIFTTIDEYNVTLTAFNTVTGCNNTKSKSVSIYSKPQVNFLLSPPPFSCNGTPSQFNDLTPIPTDSNIAAWAWDFGDAGSGQNTSTIKNPQHTYANAGDYTVSLTVTTNFFCASTLQAPVTISPTPVVSISTTPTCEDVAVNFSGTSAASITAWNWTIGSTVYNVQNPTHTFNNPGNTSATLNATATNGCIGSVTKPIVVPVKLVPDFSVAKNCINQQTVFTDITNATADPLSSQQWAFGTLGTANGSPVNFTFTNTGSVNVVLTSTTQSGCVYITPKMVNIIAAPQASFNATPNTGAPPLNVQFNNTSVNATSYQWAFKDQNNTTSTAVSPAFVYQNLGEYQPELTAFNAQNCSHTTSRTVSVVVPILNVALQGLELIEFQNGLKPAVTVFNRGNVTLTTVPLLLSFSGEVIRERVNATINPSTSYRYVFSFEFPTASSFDYFCVEAEVDDITPDDNQVCLTAEQSFISFPPYPNPSKESFRLEWIAQEAGIVNLTIVNSMGQEQQNLQLESIEGLNPVTIATAGLSAGTYFIKLKYHQFTKVYRVFVSE